jgi:mevalonate kinase
MTNSTDADVTPPTTTFTAPAKVILLGEHAVVYEQPAIAVPFPTLNVTATIAPAAPRSGVTVVSGSTRVQVHAIHRMSSNALAFAVQVTMRRIRLPYPDVLITIDSKIPAGSGFGSGAAVATVLIRALLAAADATLDDAGVNELVFEVERLHHGTPSGIDNTVIVFNKPLYFIRRNPPRPNYVRTFSLGVPMSFVVAYSGVSASTREAVRDVRKRYESDPATYSTYIRQIGERVAFARYALRHGQVEIIGRLMNENHTLLRQLTVSSLLLDTLVDAARSAGAIGAKLTGGGRGGNIIALVPDEPAAVRVMTALKDAGAAQSWYMQLMPS